MEKFPTFSIKMPYFSSQAEFCLQYYYITREGFLYFRSFSIDKQIKKVYNIQHGHGLCPILSTYGAAMVSTGVLKYDKRSAQDNRVKMSKLK